MDIVRYEKMLLHAERPLIYTFTYSLINVARMLTTYQALGQTLGIAYHQRNCSCIIQGAPLAVYSVGIAPPGVV